MLEAAPLDIAYTTTLIPKDLDADLRLKRRERVADVPAKPYYQGKCEKSRTSKKPRSSPYDMACGSPATSVDEAGPRCPTDSHSSAFSPSVTCPNCMYVLGLAEPDAYGSSMCAGSTDPSDMVPPQPAAIRAVPGPAMPTAPVMMQPPSIMQYIASLNLKPELVYALLVMIGLFLILAFDRRRT